MLWSAAPLQRAKRKGHEEALASVQARQRLTQERERAEHLQQQQQQQAQRLQAQNGYQPPGYAYSKQVTAVPLAPAPSRKNAGPQVAANGYRDNASQLHRDEFAKAYPPLPGQQQQQQQQQGGGPGAAQLPAAAQVVQRTAQQPAEPRLRGQRPASQLRQLRLQLAVPGQHALRRPVRGGRRPGRRALRVGHVALGLQEPQEQQEERRQAAEPASARSGADVHAGAAQPVRGSGECRFVGGGGWNAAVADRRTAVGGQQRHGALPHQCDSRRRARIFSFFWRQEGRPHVDCTDAESIDRPGVVRVGVGTTLWTAGGQRLVAGLVGHVAVAVLVPVRFVEERPELRDVRPGRVREPQGHGTRGGHHARLEQIHRQRLLPRPV
ncbi:hypothetical protein ON010_g3798 [Phytophthora cinnamomi]|nr:hypothetical protein ON010_g3798 [Phytophthora cinnamomi]